MTQLGIDPKSSGWALYGERFWVSTPADLTMFGEDWEPEPIDFMAKLTIDVINGRLVCTEFTASSDEVEFPGSIKKEITSEGLRRVPIAQWVELAARELGFVKVIREVGPGELELADFQMPPSDFAKDGMTAEALEATAQIYAFCMATGQKPTGVLHREFAIPRPTASRWIATARRRGILSDNHRYVERLGDLLRQWRQPGLFDEQDLNNGR
ncbi:hypothetical protein [Rhodococcus sp. NPDC055024]